MKEKTLVTLKDEISLEYPFSDDMPMVYLGEIVNMPEHGIFIGQSENAILGIIFQILEN